MSVFGWMMLPYRRYADFSGRSGRQEFWYFQLFTVLVNMLILLALAPLFMSASETGVPSPLLYVFGAIFFVFAIASIIPSWAVLFRRLHDTDRSGWNWLWGFLPLIGPIVLLVFYIQRGTEGPNRFGPDPYGMIDPEAFS